MPERVFEDQLLDFFHLLGRGNAHDEIRVDFSRTQWLITGAIVGLITKFRAWHDEGRRVVLSGFKESSSLRYLQRINFFSLCGLDIPEGFERRAPNRRFVPLYEISGATRVEDIAAEVAGCMVPSQADSWDPEETGAYDYVEYAITELANNVRQHANGRGYICAQYYPKFDTVRVAIADCGIGILESFRQNTSPHWREGMTDLEAVQKALEPRVSSKTHLRSVWGESPNAGVGLTLLRELSVGLRGNFLVLSGQGFYSLQEEGAFQSGGGFRGTLCAISFTRNGIQNFNPLLYNAKRNVGLISSGNSFAELFE